jgi:cell wall-associated NlpC family hydrolase
MINLNGVKATGISIIGLSSIFLTGCGSTIQAKKVSAPTKPAPIHKIQKIKHKVINKQRQKLQLKRASARKIKKITAADRAAWVAQKQLNIPYVWGGTTPKGFDCSGLVQYSYKVNKVRVPRTASQQYASTKRIPTHQAKSGDLVFFKNTGKRRGITHVGIYLGNGRFVHAPRKGKTVEITKVGNGFWNKHLAGFGRFAASSLGSSKG